MIKYENIHSTNAPQLIEVTPNYVYVAENIHTYSETIEDQLINGYEYDYLTYTKDEYMLLLIEKNNELAEELQATKILLGVE